MHSNDIKLHTIVVKPGHEVIQYASALLAEWGITDGVIVSVIGAVDHCCISNMPLGDAKRDVLHEYKEPLEFSGNGEISGGKIHIHCVASREGEVTLGGHLHWAKVETWFVRIFVLA